MDAENPPAAAAKPNARKHALAVAAAIGFSLLAYSNSFHAPFLYDNNEIILKDSRVQAATMDNLQHILAGPYWETKLINLYRPLTTLSYVFNYSVLGSGAAPEAYHWINFGLHGVNVALVYALGLAIFSETAPALFLSLLWGVHPVLTESVTNIVGRADLLAGFGVLAALLAYRKMLAAAGRAKAAWLVAVAAAAAVGIASKESGIAVLAILPLFDLAFPRPVAWRRRCAGYAAAVLPCLFYFWARAHALAHVPYSPVSFTDNPLVAAGFWTARLTAAKVIGKYLLLLLWPARLSCDYSYNAIPLFTWNFASWEDWKAVAGLLACLAAAAAAVWLYRRDRRVFFGIGFFFATLAPTANVMLIIGTIMAERFLYLPAVGFMLCAVCALNLLRRSRYRTAAGVALGIVLIAAAARTYARNRDWMDDTLLWSSAAEAAPGSYKPPINLALTAFRSGADSAAVARNIGRSLAILDPLPDLQNAGNAWLDAGTLYRAIADRSAGSANPQQWYRRSLAALIRCDRILVAVDAEDRRENARRGRPGLTFLPSSLYLELARTYLRLGDQAHALGAFERGHQLESQPELLEEEAALYQQMGNLRAAAADLVEALAVDSTRAEIPPRLIDLYSAIDPGGCAVVQEGDAKELNVNCPLVHSDICQGARRAAGSYARRGQRAEAGEIRRIATRQLGCDAASVQ